MITKDWTSLITYARFSVYNNEIISSNWQMQVYESIHCLFFLFLSILFLRKYVLVAWNVNTLRVEIFKLKTQQIFARSVLHQKVIRSSWWSCIIIVIRLEPQRHLSLMQMWSALVLTHTCAWTAKHKCIQSVSRTKVFEHFNTKAGKSVLRLCWC